jgi:hypothetical protein
MIYELSISIKQIYLMNHVVTFHKNIIDLFPWTTYMFCIAAQTTSGKGADICKEQQTLQDCKY